MDKPLLFTSVSSLAWPRYLLDKRLRELQMHIESECNEEISNAFSLLLGSRSVACHSTERAPQ
jgi:hypothetical protein